MADSAAELFAAVERGEAHFAVGGLLRPAPPRPPLGIAVAQMLLGAPADLGSAVLWTIGYHADEPVLIYNSDGFKPANWDDLDGETVAYVESAGLDPEIARLHAAHPEIAFRPIALPSPSELDRPGLRRRDLLRNRRLACGAPSRATSISNSTSRFPSAASARLRGPSRRGPRASRRSSTGSSRVRSATGPSPGSPSATFPRPGNSCVSTPSGLQEKMRTLLPQYRPLFRDTQSKTGLDWRLLAAIAYQESKWDSSAQSDTGVRGFMQITEDTAKLLGVTDLLDPAQSVLARGAIPQKPEGQAPRADWRTRPHVARARRLQHRPRPSRGRAHPRAEAGSQSRPLERCEKSVAPSRAARISRAGEARLCARGNARRLRRPCARVLRCSPRARAGVAAASSPVR